MPRKATLLVKAARKDCPCPKIRKRRKIDAQTGKDKTVIHHDEVVEVPNVRYYRRRILKGDLVEVKTKSRGLPPPGVTPREHRYEKKTEASKDE